ncbi:MAG: HU family DNA-binding protein, partial [Cyanobacteria bacterium P01_F01_bin.153]
FESEGVVSIDNFGRFITSRSAPRIGRDFQTGEKINIPSKLRTRFVISESLHREINEMSA